MIQFNPGLAKNPPAEEKPQKPSKNPKKTGFKPKKPKRHFPVKYEPKQKCHIALGRNGRKMER